MRFSPDAPRRRSKLAKLAEIEGFPSVEALIEGAVFDSVSPAICLNADCDYTAEMEPDQDAGFCEVCRTQSVSSALVLAGII